MKIWCQSCSGLSVGDLWSPYYESLKNHAKRVCRADTICEFHGLGRTVPGIDRLRSAWHLCQQESIRNAIRAEKAGFDAYLMISTPDPGFREIRELVDIPVVFITQATLQFSCLLAPNFAFIAHSEGLVHVLNELAERYGLKERMIPGGYLESISYLDFKKAYEDSQPLIEAFNHVAKQILARGATLLFPSALPLSQWLIDQNIREIDGATIIDPLGISLKITELMVDLEKFGIKRSKIGAYASPPKEIQEALHKEFGIS